MGVREYDYIRGNTALAPERKYKELDKERKRKTRKRKRAKRHRKEETSFKKYLQYHYV